MKYTENHAGVRAIIFFDLDETILDFKAAEYWAVRSLFEKNKQVLGTDFEGFYRSWCSIGKVHYEAFLRGELAFTEQKVNTVKDVFSLLQVDLDDESAASYYTMYLQAFENHWKLFDDVIPVLTSLANDHLGIITNGDSEQQRYKLKKLGVEPYFKIVLAAGDIGIAKPSASIFLKACHLAGKEPKECCYVGDHLETDILACEKIGMRGIWLNRKRETNHHYNGPTIHNLFELQGVMA